MISHLSLEVISLILFRFLDFAKNVKKTSENHLEPLLWESLV